MEHVRSVLGLDPAGYRTDGRLGGNVVRRLGRASSRCAREPEVRIRSPSIRRDPFVDLVVATPRNKAVIGTPLKRPSLNTHVASAVDLFFHGYGPNKD